MIESKTMKENINNDIKNKKRNLSDTWDSWKRDKKDIGYSNESPKTYALISFSVVVTFIISVLFLNYLIFPRLSEVHSIFAWSFTYLIFSFTLFVLIWYLFVLIGILAKKNLFILPKLTRILGTKLFPISVFFAKKIGINKDRLSSSFVKANNILTELSAIKYFKKKVIILTPRCLSTEYKKKLIKIAKEKDVKVYICTGGDIARQRIKKHKPDAVIALACERDLVSGLSDVQAYLPVFAIPNERPFGPCLETRFDEKYFIKSIDNLLKK